MAACDLLHGALHRVPGIFPVLIFIKIIEFFNHPVDIFLDPVQLPVHLFKKHRKNLILSFLIQLLYAGVRQVRKMMNTKALRFLNQIHKLRLMLNLIEKGIDHSLVSVVHSPAYITVRFLPVNPAADRGMAFACAGVLLLFK